MYYCHNSALNKLQILKKETDLCYHIITEKRNNALPIKLKQLLIYNLKALIKKFSLICNMLGKTRLAISCHYS